MLRVHNPILRMLKQLFVMNEQCSKKQYLVPKYLFCEKEKKKKKKSTSSTYHLGNSKERKESKFLVFEFLSFAFRYNS